MDTPTGASVPGLIRYHDTMESLIEDAKRELHELSLSLLSDDYETYVSAYYALDDITAKLKNAQILLGFQL